MNTRTSRLEVRIHEEIKRELEEIAREQNKTISEIIRDLIEFYTRIADRNFDVERLVKEALERPTESKYLLTLETWYKSTDLYEDYCQYDVIYGEVDDFTVEVEELTTIAKRVLVPKSMPTIILYTCRDTSVEPTYEKEVLYVFTPQGWKAIRLS